MRRFFALFVLLALAASPAMAQPSTDSTARPLRGGVGMAALRTPAPVPPSVVVRAPSPDTLAVDEGTAPSPQGFRPGRFYGGLGALVAGDVAVLTALSGLWYDENRVDFHLYKPARDFDDGWLDDWHTYVQQDKLGHVLTAWHLARVLGEYAKWSGVSKGEAGLFGGFTSIVFQTQIEFLDGFDPSYGASRTDILANIAGGVMGGLKIAYPEPTAWFDMKYSYRPSRYYDEYVSANPVLRYAGNAIKDYDGISYWLVVKPHHLLPETTRWPDWLGVGMGYSGTNLAHPISGLSEPQHQGLPNVHGRQFFIGPDFDLIERIPVPKALRPVRTFFSFVRVPAPALELGARGARLHLLYF